MTIFLVLQPPPPAPMFACTPKELLPELLEAGSTALLDDLDAMIPHISGGSASVEDFVAKKKAVLAAHQDNPRHVEVRPIVKSDDPPHHLCFSYLIFSPVFHLRAPRELRARPWREEAMLPKTSTVKGNRSPWPRRRP